MLLENPHVKGNLELFVILIQEGHLLTPETGQVKAFLQPATIFRKKKTALDCLRTVLRKTSINTTHPLYEKKTGCRSGCTICQQNTVQSRGCRYWEEGNRNDWEDRKSMHKLKWLGLFISQSRHLKENTIIVLKVRNGTSRVEKNLRWDNFVPWLNKRLGRHLVKL